MGALGGCLFRLPLGLAVLRTYYEIIALLKEKYLHETSSHNHVPGIPYPIMHAMCKFFFLHMTMYYWIKTCDGECILYKLLSFRRPVVTLLY